jgi:hypothetical protein
MKKEQSPFPSELNSLVNRLKYLKYKCEQLDPETWKRDWVENILAEYDMVLEDIKNSPKISAKDKTKTVKEYKNLRTHIESMLVFTPLVNS